MNCQYCLTPLGRGKFCGNCGASVPATPPAFEPQQPAWDSDPRNVNVNPQTMPQGGYPTQPTWQPVQPVRRPFYSRWWFWLLVVFGVFFVIGFFAADGESEGGTALSEIELVGTWHWDENALWYYTFYADGTGSRSTYEWGREYFNWSVSGSTLRIESQTRENLQWDRRIERWTMRYDGNRLSLSLEGTTHHYLRGAADNFDEPEPDLTVTAQDIVGTWNWDTNAAWQYFFHINGEGFRGGGPSPVVEFEWTVQDGVLYIDIFGMVEEWAVRIENNEMTLRSLQVAGVMYRYERAR